MRSTFSGVRLHVPARVVSRAVDETTVLLDTSSGRYFALDPIGSRVWSRLSSSSTVEEACRALLEDFEVDPDRLHEDVNELIERLVAEGLVEILRVDA